MSKPIQRIFLEHPDSVGESYFEHMQVASTIGWKLLLCSLAAFIHGLVPCLFKDTASKAIKEMHGKVANRGSTPVPGDSSLKTS